MSLSTRALLPWITLVVFSGCGDGDIVRDAIADGGLPASPDAARTIDATLADARRDDSSTDIPDAQQDASSSASPRLDAAAASTDASVDAGPDISNGPLTPLVGGDGVVLPFRVVDAEYSDSLDRLVIAASDPNRLVVLDADSGSFAAVPLTLTPYAVSVAPDGLRAAVGHNGYMVLIELAPLRVQRTYSVSADVEELVLAGNGYVYAWSRSDTALHSIELSSGTETLLDSAYSETTTRLHPSGDRMYGADHGISPDEVWRFDFAGGPASVSYDSPLHGTYPMCSNLWFSQDGARIFTACGNTFHASNTRAEDLTYFGTLAGKPALRSLDHSSATRLIATLHGYSLGMPNTSGATLHDLSIYQDPDLSFRLRLPLPKFEVNGKQYAGEGRFVYFNAHSSRLYALIEAEAAAPTLQDFGLARFTVGGAQADISVP